MTKSASVRVATALIFGFAGLLVLRVTSASLLPPASVAGSHLVGDHPKLFLEAARRFSLVPGATAPDARSRRLSSEEPLSEMPYMLAARVMLAAGANRRAEVLLQEALRRNPRLREARLLLVQENAQSGDPKAMAQQLVALARLMPNANELLMSSLAQLVLDPATRVATMGALRDNVLLEGVLNTLATMEAEPVLILQLSQGLPTNLKSSGDAPWRAKLVSILVNRGDYENARDVWRRVNAVEAGDGGNHIYNPEFAKDDSPPPFNWTFAQGGAGVAEPSGQKSLYITYYGREEGDLASQLLLLPAGRYRMNFATLGEATDGAGKLQWAVSCLGRPRPEQQIAIPPSGSSRSVVRSALMIPDNCPAQWLTLKALPGEFARTRSAEISQLSIEELQ